jgi:hypothetical protein
LSVTIHKRNDVASRRAGTGLDGRSIAEALWVTNDFGASVACRLCCVVVRAVVNNDYFCIRILLKGVRYNSTDGAAFILGRNYYG